MENNPKQKNIVTVKDGKDFYQNLKIIPTFLTQNNISRKPKGNKVSIQK